ncbi:MAG: TolC family protein [Ignavibacteriales bacterium]|nr:Outer membrane protein TolC [Ignavibacteriaceae bacterium]QOJ29427.1 MAG: TolC family protein [Ignavibacteriales bacterium]
MKFSGIIVFLIFMFSASHAQSILTLEDAVNIALQKNTVFLQSQENLKSFEASNKSAFGALLPAVGADFSWNWNRNQSSATTPGLFGGSSSSSLDSRSYSAGIGGSWTLFDGLASYANLDRSESNLEAARLNFQKLKQDIMYQTLAAYYDVLTAKKLLAVKEDDLKWNRKNFEIIQERNRLGSVTIADVYAQQVKLGNAELEAIRAQNNYETLKSNFFYSLGIDVFENYEFEDKTEQLLSLELGEGSIGSLKLEDIINQALRTRQDYQSTKLSLLSADESITIAKSGYLPSLRNTFSFGTQSDRPGDLFKNKSYSVGLTLDIPIFSGWSTDQQVQLAQIDKTVKELELRDLEREIKRDLLKNYLDLQASEKRLEVGKSNVLAASENRKIEEEKYLLGATTLLNVLIANSEYTNAQTSYITAQFDYLKLKEQLDYQIGLLDSSNFGKK